MSKTNESEELTKLRNRTTEMVDSIQEEIMVWNPKKMTHDEIIHTAISNLNEIVFSGDGKKIYEVFGKASVDRLRSGASRITRLAREGKL